MQGVTERMPGIYSLPVIMMMLFSFTYEENWSQRGEVPCPRSHSNLVAMHHTGGSFLSDQRSGRVLGTGSSAWDLRLCGALSLRRLLSCVKGKVVSPAPTPLPPSGSGASASCAAPLVSVSASCPQPHPCPQLCFRPLGVVAKRGFYRSPRRVTQVLSLTYPAAHPRPPRNHLSPPLQGRLSPSCHLLSVHAHLGLHAQAAA